MLWLCPGGGPKGPSLPGPAPELDGTGNLVSRFVYGTRANVPDFVIRGGVTYRVFSDHLGSPRVAVNIASVGDVPVNLTYEAFGAVSGTGIGWMPQGFAGGIYDSDTGLVRFEARDFDPNTGRWISKDEVLFKGGLNLYVYSLNDPLNLHDATGRNPAGIAVGGAAYLGACAIYALAQTDAADYDKEKHCIASCVFNRCTSLAFPWLTAAGGYLWEKFQGWAI
jgi:RHS repeat-associated protein